ncbi:MAG: hypothetical protein ACE5EX_01430, partial [Phycisphaerae bacterium]
MIDLFAGPLELVQRVQTCRATGRVAEVTGLTIVAEGLYCPVGSLCRIECRRSSPMAAQVVGVNDDRVVLMALEDPQGIATGDPVTSTAAMQTVPVGRGMLGCVLDGMGRRIGGSGEFTVERHYPVYTDAPEALSRRPIDEPLTTGIRAIDAMHTVGRG